MMGDYTEHLISMAGGDGDVHAEGRALVAAIHERKRKSETVTVQRESLRLLRHWAVMAGADQGLYSVRKAVEEASSVLDGK